jgi:sugar phosphate isomerase/epimerase
VTRPLGLAALTILEVPHHEQVTVAAQAGYSHVGLRLVPVAGQPVWHEIDAPEIEKRLADSGVRVLDVEVFRLQADTDVSVFAKPLELAGRLGATEILVHGADPDEARLVERFSRLCELAAPHGIAANIEPMPWVDVSTVAKALRILNLARKANGAVLVDAIHFFRADNRLEDLATSPLREALRYAQFCDAHPGRPADMQETIRQARGDRLFPGEGALDLRGLIAALPPELPLSLEVPVARKLAPLERATLAIEATRKLLGAR